jgi:hypothetical protein
VLKKNGVADMHVSTLCTYNFTSKIYMRCDLVKQMCSGIGVHVHHSRDGGISFQDITEDVYGNEGLQDCRGSHTPVPYFVREGALLGSDTGDIIVCKDASHGGWKKLCKVPGHITTLTESNRNSSSVTH